MRAALYLRFAPCARATPVDFRCPLKCECEACDYTVRTARKWLETAGSPLYPIEGHGPMRHDPIEGDEETDRG